MTLIPFDDLGGEGPWFHLAHANSYPPGAYTQLARQLSQQHHVVGAHTRPLLPGASPDELTSWHQIADDLVEFLRQQQIGEVIGGGHSLGGVATLYAAATHPHLFRAIILIEPVFFAPAVLETWALDPDARNETPLVGIARKRRRTWSDKQSAFQYFRAKSVYRRWSDAALLDYVNHGLVRDNHDRVTLRYTPEWEARIYQLVPHDIWEVLQTITVPTLGIRAAESKTLRPDAWSYWQSVQSQATFVEIGDSDHLLPFTHPQLLAHHILKFLDNLN